MTLCIAAHADELLGQKIVLCHDRQMGDDYSVSHMARKRADPFAGEVTVLCSGTMDHLDELLQVYRDRNGSTPLSLRHFREELYVGFKEFREGLKRRGQRTTDAHLIVAGFIERVPKIISVNKDGVFEVPSFCAIGSGAPHADTILRFRDSVKQAPLDMVIYFVYEAKKFGELSPHVGKTTILEVLSRTREGVFTIQGFRHELDILEQWFRELGPKDFSAAAGLPPLLPSPSS